MADPKVTTSVRLWSDEVDLAKQLGRERQMVDGDPGIARLVEDAMPLYEFSNRNFYGRPYE